jgi:hypothetical protein
MERQDLVRWLADYKRSWEELDTELLVSLFTADASYYPTPFWIPFKGSGDLRKLWDNLKGHQSENHIDLVLLALDGDKAVVRWQGYSTPIGGAGKRRGDGIFLLTFDQTRKCCELLEWQHWHSDDEPKPRYKEKEPVRTS